MTVRSQNAEASIHRMENPNEFGRPFDLIDNGQLILKVGLIFYFGESVFETLRRHSVMNC